MRIQKCLMAPVALIALTSSSIEAHHSYAMFDMTKTLVLAGTFKSVHWTNPHTWYTITVPQPDGKVAQWGLEGPSPVVLTRQGWRENSIKAGDKAAVTVHPHRDGMLVASLTTIAFDDGHTLQIRSPRDAPNAETAK